MEERIKNLERAVARISQVQRDHENRLYGNKERGDAGLVDMVRLNRRIVISQMVIAVLFVVATGVQVIETFDLVSLFLKLLSI